MTGHRLPAVYWQREYVESALGKGSTFTFTLAGQ